MKDLFKVMPVVDKKKDKFEFYFDDRGRAERFVNAMTTMLTTKGRKHVKFVCEIIRLFESDEDLLKELDDG